MLFAFVAALAYEKVAVEFMHGRRQDALISQFNAAPKSSALAFGDAVAVLQIPSIGINTVIGEGETHATMRAGPSHRADSPMPGTVGNAIIAGKSFRYGAPFARLGELAVGGEIYVKLRTADPVLYVIDEVATFNADDETPFEPTNDATLTLVTSTSRFGGDALVVHATAAPGSVVVPSANVTAAFAGPHDGVSFIDFAVVAIWLAVCAVLAYALMRAPAQLGPTVKVVVFAPIATLAALQFLLALERFFAATV